jgi:nucleoside-diphosphate-sugar epimerase
MTQTVYNNDIFNNLPTFPNHDGKKYTAIVTGANGITGAHLIRVLAAAPERWETVYALSRRVPTEPALANVKHLAIDFLKSPDEIVEELRKGGVGKV